MSFLKILVFVQIWFSSSNSALPLTMYPLLFRSSGPLDPRPGSLTTKTLGMLVLDLSHSPPLLRKSLSLCSRLAWRASQNYIKISLNHLF